VTQLRLRAVEIEAKSFPEFANYSFPRRNWN